MKKPAIPQVPQGNQPRAAFDQAIKESLEIVTGRRAGRIEPLPAGATTDEIVAKLNEVIARLQG
jgi:hypothetical protein